MGHEELRGAIDKTGDELGWDEATRVAKFESAQRRTLAKRAVIQVVPFTRQPTTWERLRAWASEPETEAGATVVDELAGASYDVVLDTRGRPTYFAVRALGGALPSVAELSRDEVSALARDFLAQYTQGDESDREVIVTTDRDRALRLAKGDERPRHEYVAEIIRAAVAIGDSPRAALRAKTGKPWPTVDRWLREARAADPRLPQATRHPGKRK